MVVIPPTLADDTEDVVWALQTADALWKRNERVDAIVWLRRAAQAAGDAQDDDRALVLARGAAELAEWIAHHPASGAVSTQVPRSAAPPGPPSAVVDELLRRAQSDDEVTLPDLSAEPPPSRPSLSEALRKLGHPEETVRTAAEAHAGILDPWAPTDVSPREPVPPSPAAADVYDELRVEEMLTGAPIIEAEDALDLSDVEAFADLPDDTREAFADDATLHDLERGDEVSGFALVLVLAGELDVTAASLDFAAARLRTGVVLRCRGTIDEVAPLRLVAATDGVRVATWNEEEVARAFGACPWVEEELRGAADLTHALVGVTLGPLGERLDPALRAEITGKLHLRVLAGEEVFVRAGAPVPGFLIVGAGMLEFIDSKDSPRPSLLRAGDFLFPSEVLRAAVAPSTVQAVATGALVLTCDRKVAQELLVTCPPLLEIFAEAF